MSRIPYDPHTPRPTKVRKGGALKQTVLFQPVVAVAIIILSASVLVLGDVEARQQGDPQATVMTACTACHSTRRICDNLGEKDREEWTRTVTEMVSRGADVAGQDIAAVAEYLANLEPGSEPVCR